MTPKRAPLHPRLLIVDRDPRYREWLQRHLGILFPDATVRALDPNAFEFAFEELSHDDIDLLVICASFGATPEDTTTEGLAWLRRLRTRATLPPAFAIAEDGNELTAVRALQLGALDYVPKRLLTADRLRTAMRIALRRVERRIARRLAKLQHTSSTEDDLHPPPPEGETPAEPVPVDLIPGYAIVTEIGESEKANVYRATSAALGRDIALKVSKRSDGDPSEGQLLAREYAALSNLHHPAIVEIHDYGAHAGHEYLAMEYFPRGDLKARLSRGLTEVEALRYLERIAAALQVVHAAGLLHRDLKPPNVMLRENDEVVLIDFGLARHLEGGLQSTRVGVLRGSPYYMSPEQALGEKLDARTDLYSLGIVFYEMLTRQKPFTGTSAIEVLQEHVNAPVPRLPAGLARHQELLDRLLAKTRDERFASADELLAALAETKNPRSSAA